MDGRNDYDRYSKVNEPKDNRDSSYSTQQNWNQQNYSNQQEYNNQQNYGNQSTYDYQQGYANQQYNGNQQYGNQQGYYNGGNAMYDRYHIPPEQLHLAPYRKSNAKAIIIVISVVFLLSTIIGVVSFGHLTYKLATDPWYRYEFESEHSDSPFWHSFIEGMEDELDEYNNYDDNEYDFDEDDFFDTNDIDV